MVEAQIQHPCLLFYGIDVSSQTSFKQLGWVVPQDPGDAKKLLATVQQCLKDGTPPHTHTPLALFAGEDVTVVAMGDIVVFKLQSFTASVTEALSLLFARLLSIAFTGPPEFAQGLPIEF